MKFKRLLRRIARKSNFLSKITKRQKYVITVVILSLVLFFAENLFGKSGIYVSLLLSILTDVFLLWSVYQDFKDTKSFSFQIFILPFFFSLSFGLFYFLVPARFITRVIMTSLYAVGLYSLLLSVNIFIASSVRTIALLSSARTVSFVITLLSYFFLSNVLFSLHLNIFLNLILLFSYSFPLIMQAIWTYTLENKFLPNLIWILSLTLCLIDFSVAIWFFPVIPTIIALFLTGIFYITVGLSQVWFEKRFFRNIMWEYVWVAFIIFILFSIFIFRS